MLLKILAHQVHAGKYPLKLKSPKSFFDIRYTDSDGGNGCKKRSDKDPRTDCSCAINFSREVKS